VRAVRPSFAAPAFSCRTGLVVTAPVLRRRCPHGNTGAAASAAHGNTGAVASAAHGNTGAVASAARGGACRAVASVARGGGPARSR
jgi:hypothetical protein